MPVIAAGGQHQLAPQRFGGDMRQGERQSGTFVPDVQQHLADIPHPAGAHGVLTEADFLPLSVLINAAAGDGDVDMRVPVESSAVRVDGAENTDIQRPFSGGVQQIIDGQAAEVVKQPAVDLKQGPQCIGEGEDEVYPVAVRQAVKLGGDPDIGGLFTAGGAGTAVAGVGDIFNMVAVRIIAAIFLHAGDTGAAGQHLCDGFDFDIAQAAGIQEGGPALVGGEQFFERAGAETRNHRAD